MKRVLLGALLLCTQAQGQVLGTWAGPRVEYAEFTWGVGSGVPLAQQGYSLWTPGAFVGPWVDKAGFCKALGAPEANCANLKQTLNVLGAFGWMPVGPLDGAASRGSVLLYRVLSKS